MSATNVGKSEVTDQTRQYGSLESIRADHVNRYKFAVETIKSGVKNGFTPRYRVLDAACGCGYGSKMLQELGRVVGVDIERQAIDYANANYSGSGYLHGNILDKPWVGTFDVITSFETIEHIDDAAKVLRLFRESLDGTLFISTPNEDLYPFSMQNFVMDDYPHLRHYTPSQFDHLLEDADFQVVSRHCQRSKTGEVVDGVDGMFLVYVCK